jgi:acetyltransferase-like isoleucine patch superfamily enzyme
MSPKSTRGTLMRPMSPSNDQAGPSVKERGGATIGNRVWIGYGATIVSGVTVGDGAVIGVGSLVTNDVPPNTVVRGAPARPVRRRFADYVIAAMPRFRWSDFRVFAQTRMLLCVLAPFARRHLYVGQAS